MSNREFNQSFGARKLLVGVVGTIVLGAIGSGLWEMLFRPGLGRIGNAVTSASERTERFVYTTAALDPTPIPDLLVLLLIVQIPALMAFFFIERGFIRPLMRKRIDAKFLYLKEEAAKSDDPTLTLKASLTKRIKVLSLIGTLYSAVFFGLFFYAYMIENKAVVVWRVFHQNLEIVAPHIGDTDLKIFKSQFRSMKSRRDFELIRENMDSKAMAAGIRLDWRDRR